VECEHVLVAIGQAPELEFATSGGQLVVTKGRVQVDPVTQKAGDGLFVGGDAATGPATIVEAVAAGQRAAQAIDVFLGGKGELPPDTPLASPGKPEESQAQAGRRPIRARPPAKCRGNFDEVIKGYSLQAACAEARRCLRCDLE
jgi:NADH-quinone oxidoreductase subunit F